MSASDHNLILGIELVPELAVYLAQQGVGRYVDPDTGTAYGTAAPYEIKTNTLSDRPIEQVSVRANGGPRDPGEVLARIHFEISVRDKNVKTAKAMVRKIVDLLDKKVPPLPSYQIQFVCDSHEDKYRDRNNHVVFPLPFSSAGAVAIGV